MFVGEKKKFHRKTPDETDEAKFKRASSSLKRKALAIGYKALYDKDTEKCVINCIPEHLRPKSRRQKNTTD
jgi:hypothetical protein